MDWIRLAVRRAARILGVCFVTVAVRGQSSHPAAPVPAAPTSAAQFVVVIDPAHGGDDTGGHLSDGPFEKAATLGMAGRLRSLLTARGFQVMMTRESDATVSPEQRATIANRANPLACISLHTAETGSGVHLFASNLTPAPVTQFMPWKTAQAGWMTRSLALTGVLNSALQHAGVTVTLGRTALPGIDSMTCPAVAVELAPERGSDRRIGAEPDNQDYQAQVAGVLATALLQWRGEQANRGARHP